MGQVLLEWNSVKEMCKFRANEFCTYALHCVGVMKVNNCNEMECLVKKNWGKNKDE